MPSLVEIDPVVLKKKIFKVGQCIFAISLLFPLGKGPGPSFDQTWIPFTQGCFVPSLVEISPVVLEKKMKMWKVYANDDDRQISIRKVHLSLRLRWAKNWSKLGFHFASNIGILSSLKLCITISIFIYIVTRGPRAWMVTWVSETLQWLLVRRAHTCISTAT